MAEHISIVERRRQSQAIKVHRRGLDAGHAFEQSATVDVAGGAGAGVAIGDLAGLATWPARSAPRCCRPAATDAASSAQLTRTRAAVTGAKSLTSARSSLPACSVGLMTNTVSAPTISMCPSEATAFPTNRGADGVIGAAAVLDDHLLAPGRHQALRDQPSHDVADAARHRRHHDGDGLARVGLGAQPAEPRQALPISARGRSSATTSSPSPRPLTKCRHQSSASSISLCPAPYSQLHGGALGWSAEQARGAAEGTRRRPAARTRLRHFARKMSTYSV